MTVFDTEALLSLSLPDHLVSMWQIFLYIAVLITSLMLHRVRLCLLITYMFTYYLAFTIYWADIIENAGTLTPFFLYVGSGLAIVVLFAVASFSEQARIKRG
jgi:hypothetical protein